MAALFRGGGFDDADPIDRATAGGRRAAGTSDTPSTRGWMTERRLDRLAQLLGQPALLDYRALCEGASSPYAERVDRMEEYVREAVRACAEASAPRR
ncbi:hypothetical protein CDCA_CDCA09G2776 [Cyanidium caldarium]|uniref:Uncharacterized protein n=1 Tax=Cyanidium caldarium TaxID=2771 RepID=A0AAV9IX72_CYACA|nr:hypothetical protein CDCA_CDCA09G2776 [Cyanidium caldarium]